jgi:hypothetical protein
MLTDDDIKRIAEMMAPLLTSALEAYGLKKLPSAGALRTQRYRERKASQNVTAKRHKTSHGNVTKASPRKGEGVTKPSQPSVTPTAETWAAYSTAYRTRYGVDPTRNATVNGQLAQFVGRVPAAEAPEIAAFYVLHNKHFYISSRHAVGALLRDAEGLRTEWLSGRTVTDTEARQADRTQSNANVWGKLIKEAEREAK